MAPQDEPGSASNTAAAPASATDPDKLGLSQRLAAGLQNFTASVLRDTSATLAAVREAVSGQSVPGNLLHAFLPALKLLLFTVLGPLLAFFVFLSIAKCGFARLNVGNI